MIRSSSVHCLLQEYAASGDDAVPEPIRAAVTSVLLQEQAQQQGASGQISPQLRKRTYPEAEPIFRKRNRRDVRMQAAAEGAQINQHL